MKNRIIELGLLALKAEATDEEVLAALKANLALAAALPEIAVALGLEKTADAAQIKGTIVALKQGQEQLATLQTEVAALKAESAQGKARMAVDAALAAKKITPAQTEWALSYAARDAEGFKAFVAAAAPVLAPTELKIPANDKEPGGVVDESGLAVCKQMGIDPKDFLANKQQLAAGQ